MSRILRLESASEPKNFEPSLKSVSKRLPGLFASTFVVNIMILQQLIDCCVVVVVPNLIANILLHVSSFVWPS